MALISFEDDPWLGEHDACEQLHRNIQSQLLTLSNESRSSPFYAQLSADIRTRLRQYRGEVFLLSELLDKIKREQIITDAEHERRFRQIEVLQSKYMLLQNQFNNVLHSTDFRVDNGDSSADRQELFGNTSGPSKGKTYGQVKTVDWGVDSDDDDLLEDTSTLIQKFEQKKKQIMKEQDKGLEELSKIISHQKNIAENIGNEVSLQNDIIDDLGEHIERSNNRVHSETDQIRMVDTSDNTCRYWTIIILLFIAIIVVAIVF